MSENKPIVLTDAESKPIVLTDAEIESSVNAYRHALKTGSVEDIEFSGAYDKVREWKQVKAESVNLRYIFRIRPKPTHRPWTMNEFFKGAISGWFRRKENMSACRVTRVDADGFIWVGGRGVKSGELLRDYEWSYCLDSDNAKWYPCGVEE